MTEFLVPRSLKEATELIAEHGRSVAIMAGGTSAMRCGTCRGMHGRGLACVECPGPRLVGVSHGSYLMGIRHLGLDRIEQRNGTVSLGAGVSMSRVQAEGPFPALREAARQIGGPALRNMATVGGNVFAHQPYGDVAVVLLALDATLNFAEIGGERRETLSDFYARGARPNGLLRGIDVAAPQGRLVYFKCGRRRFNSPTVITVAVDVGLEGGCVSSARIALGGASAHPIRSGAVEQALMGSTLDDATIAGAADLAAENCAPATDMVATEWYRRRMVRAYVRRALERIADDPGGGGG